MMPRPWVLHKGLVCLVGIAIVLAGSLAIFGDFLNLTDSADERAREQIPTCTQFAPREFGVHVPEHSQLDDYGQVFLALNWTNIRTKEAWSGGGFSMKATCMATPSGSRV